MPKRGALKPAAKRQESATFLQRSFFDVAVQFFICCSAAFGPNDFRTAEKPMLQCSFCSAAFRKLQRNFRFRLWHVAGVGFRGVGFRTCRHLAFSDRGHAEASQCRKAKLARDKSCRSLDVLNDSRDSNH